MVRLLLNCLVQADRNNTSRNQNFVRISKRQDFSYKILGPISSQHIRPNCFYRKSYVRVTRTVNETTLLMFAVYIARTYCFSASFVHFGMTIVQLATTAHKMYMVTMGVTRR